MEKQSYGFYFNPNHCSSRLMYRVNKNFKNLINFDQQQPQTFVFPYFIIEYICINCKTRLSQKLMNLCKYLRCLQVRVGYAHIDCMVAEQYYGFSDLILDIQIIQKSDLYRFQIPDFSRICTEFQTIKINQQLEIRCPRKEKIDEFLLSLNLTNLRSIYIGYQGLTLPSNVVDHLLSGSLEFLEMSNIPHQNYLIKWAFLNLQNLGSMKFLPTEEIKLETFKALINTNRSKQKLNTCEIDLLSFDIKAEEIFQFVDTQMKSSGSLELSYNSRGKVLPEEAEKLKSEIQTRMNERKENKIPTCYIRVSCITISSTWILDFLKVRGIGNGAACSN